jgi:hypothetical protein
MLPNIVGIPTISTTPEFEKFYFNENDMEISSKEEWETQQVLNA